MNRLITLTQRSVTPSQSFLSIAHNFSREGKPVEFLLQSFCLVDTFVDDHNLNKTESYDIGKFAFRGYLKSQANRLRKSKIFCNLLQISHDILLCCLLCESAEAQNFSLALCLRLLRSYDLSSLWFGKFRFPLFLVDFQVWLLAGCLEREISRSLLLFDSYRLEQVKFDFCFCKFTGERKNVVRSSFFRLAVYVTLRVSFLSSFPAHNSAW